MNRLAFAVIMVLLMSACGGGGSSSPPANQNPVANAGADQTVDENTIVTLNGSASRDADGTVTTYSWSQTAGAAVVLSATTVAMPTFTAPMVGAAAVLTFRLTVTDDDGATNTDTVTVIVSNSINAAPVANAGTDQTVNEGTAVALNGSASSDSDGTISTYAWLQTIGPAVALTNAGSAMPTFTAPSVNANTTLTFTLTVTDNSGATHSDSVDVQVLDLGNITPAANAGTDQTVNEGAAVTLNGSASTDSDGTISTYAWTQTAGTAVALTGANTAMPGFTAPTVNANTTLTFSLTVTDDQGASSTDTVNIVVSNTLVNVTISGKVTYDHVPHNPATDGLNYSGTTQDPVRGATVQALSATSVVLATTQTNSTGDYALTLAPSTPVRIRVRAEIIKTGLPAWDVRLVDNTSGGAAYVLDGSLTDSGTANSTRNLNAASGWSLVSNAYTSTRASAPFAILDSIYEAVTNTAAEDPSVVFPPVLTNWSINNSTCSGDTTTGCIETSNYDGTGIFILGAANNDTDEFDGHIIVHEWGHYFEDKLSRSDSMGGPHGGGDALDIRIAFSEGFGNGLSGIITGDPAYRDSSGTGQSSGFEINVDNNSVEGWFSESTVQSVLYDLFDSNADGAGDNVALGWGPLYNTLTGNTYKTIGARVSLHAYLAKLKAENPGSAAAITALATARNVNGSDAFGAGETFLPTGTINTGDIVPVYTNISPNGTRVTVCSINEFGTFNKLSNRRFLKLNIATNATYRFQVTSSGATPDPDLFVHKNAATLFVFEAVGNEDQSRALTPGVHVLEAFDYCNIEPGDGTCPGAGNARTCINVTVTQL